MTAAKAPFPYMKLYWADYLADTQTLSTEESGAYMHILGAMWIEGGTVPDDPVVLARIAKTSVRRWKNNLAWKLQPYFIRLPGLLTQKRLMFELERARKETSRQRSNGRRSGAARVRQRVP